MNNRCCQRVRCFILWHEYEKSAKLKITFCRLCELLFVLNCFLYENLVCGYSNNVPI